MKITRRQLKQIVKEEIMLNEESYLSGNPYLQSIESNIKALNGESYSEDFTKLKDILESLLGASHATVAKVTKDEEWLRDAVMPDLDKIEDRLAALEENLEDRS